MIKKISITIASLLLCASTFAQESSGNSTSGSFRPQKGNWQISINLGSGTFLPTEELDLLLPDNKLTTSSTTSTDDLGISGSNYYYNQSSETGYLLNLGSFNDNSLLNVAALQAAYFVSDRFQLNATLSMDFASNPSKDYVDGISVNDTMSSTYTSSSDQLDIPGYLYMDGTISAKYMASLGANYYFRTKCEKIQLYAGLAGGLGIAYISATTPYTGLEITSGDNAGDPVELYQYSNRAGKVQALSAYTNIGIEYNFTPNLNLAIEISPISYTNSFVEMQLQGLTSYKATHHYIKAFSFPTIKFGIRL